MSLNFGSWWPIWIKNIITIRNSSCGKVMFSQACVKNSVHGGACLARGACVVGGYAWQEGHVWRRGMCGREGMCDGGHAWHWGYVWQGAVHGWGACVARGGVCGSRDSHCSGRYASYWNAFLFISKTSDSDFGIVQFFTKMGQQRSRAHSDAVNIHSVSGLWRAILDLVTVFGVQCVALCTWLGHCKYIISLNDRQLIWLFWQKLTSVKLKKTQRN